MIGVKVKIKTGRKWKAILKEAVKESKTRLFNTKYRCGSSRKTGIRCENDRVNDRVNDREKDKTNHRAND